MTIYGWDTSRYDGNLTRAILQRAKAEGISFWSHKIGEGGAVDPLAKEAFAEAQGVFDVIGGYYFLHGQGDPAAAAAECIALADQVAPYWRTMPGWFWQPDAETSSTGMPSPAYIKGFSDALAAKSGKLVVVYASAGMYTNRLSGLGHLLWNANYGAEMVGAFKTIYPGDTWRGWNSYSGQEPALLQYSSKATIAGLTTCDANAFRGTLDDLLALIGAKTDVELTDKLPGGTTVGAALDLILSRTNNLGPWEKTELDAIEHQGTALASAASVKALSDKLDEVLTALKAPTVGITIGAGDLAVSGTLHVAPPAVG